MIGSIIGGIIGSGAQRDAIKAAGAAQAAAMNEAKALYNDPALVEQLKLEELMKGENYNPYLIQPTDVGKSEMAGVSENADLKDAQLNALNMLRQRSTTGLGPEDRAALNQVRGEVQRDAEAKRQQILQNMQARGLGGSGAELAMQIAGAQSSADQASEESDRLAAMASQNALAALAQYGNQAGNLQAQDLGLQTNKAQAADEFNRFNIEGRRQAQASNVGAQNQGQQYNIGRANEVSDTNITNRNQELGNVRNLKNQRAANLANLAVGSGAQQAQTQMALGTNRAQMAGALGGGFDQIGMSVAGAMSGNPMMAMGGKPPSSSSNTQSAFSSMGQAAHGGIVPGTPEVEGDSPENDKVHAMLSPGEIVLPRSIAKSKDHEVVMDFIKALQSKKD